MPGQAPFRRDGRFIRDAQDRVRIFRGVNVSGRSKMPPFLPFEDPAPLDQLQAWGFNVVRLLVLWEGLEPQRGEVDATYLAAIDRMIEHAAARGLSVVVDLHQDLYARSHGGDGAPPWAVPHRGRPARGRQWFLHYASSRAVQRNFAAFWANQDGLLSAYLATLQTLVARMNRHANVIGYDCFNEPMTTLAPLLTGHFEAHTLRAFHEACARVLSDEAAGPPRLHFIEPTPIVAFGVPCRMRHHDGPHAVFAPHLYDATAIGTGRYRRRLSTIPRALANVVGWANAHAMPLFVGEFGVLNGTIGARAMLEDQCERMDRVFASWTAWHYDVSSQDWNDENASIVTPGGGEREYTAALVRPYPRAIAGEPTRWDSTPDRPWRFSYVAGLRAATEIVVPRRWAGDAPRAQVDGGTTDWNDDRSVLEVRAEPGTSVTVTLDRGP